MKKIIITTVFSAIIQFALGQAFVNTGQIYQSAGSYLCLSGGTKWQNDGTANLQSGSYAYFLGNADQEIDGTNSTAFANLTINNSGTHGVIVNRNIQVLDTLSMVSGYLDLKNNEVDLSTSGTLTGETETCRVRATDTSWNEGGGTGRLKATRTNPTGNVAGMGLTFTPSTNMGSTVIYRGHDNQSGANLTTSIFRYYELQPTTYATLAINPFSYFDAELHGITEADLKIMQLYNSSNYWQEISTTLNTTSNQAVGNTVSNSLSNIKITLAKAPCSITANAFTNSPVCTGDTLNLSSSATNGYGTLSYNWSGPNSFTSTSQNPSISSATTAASGTYSVTITDELNCTTTDSTTVTVNPLPNVSAGSDTAICTGNAITLSGSGANSYVWDNGVTDNVSFTPTSTTTYTVTGTDTNGCSNSDSVTITVNPTYLYNETAGICNGQSYTWHGNTYINPGTYYDSLTTTTGCDSIFVLTLNVGVTFTDTNNYTICQGDSYSWHGNDYSLAGTYYDSLTTTAGCDSIFVLNLSVNPTYSTTENYTICQGGSYLWHGNNYSLAGTYYDSLTTTTGCDSVFVLNLLVNPTYSTTENQSICQGDSLLWHGNYYSLSGTYYDSLTTTTGCDSIIILNLTITPIPNIMIQAQNDSICQGASTSLTASGAATYLWSTNETSETITVNPTTTTTYYVVGTNNGCSDSAYITITVNPLPTINIVANHQAVCPGSTVVISASGAASYVWSTSETSNTITVSPENTTTYTVTGTLNGCSNTASTQIVVYPSYNATQNEQICDGSVYTWNGNQYTSSGTYTLNLQTVNGCDSTLTLQLTVHPKPALSINATDTLIIIGNSTTLTVSGDASTFVWNPITGLSCSNCTEPSASPESTTEYCVVGSNSYGCSDTACIVITVDNDCGELFIPLAFSPNGDGKNDVWKVQGRCVTSFDLKIYDRWGEKVFETTDMHQGWDGIFRNKQLDTDVYVYMLNITMRDGTTLSKKGDITLMR